MNRFQVGDIVDVVDEYWIDGMRNGDRGKVTWLRDDSFVSVRPVGTARSVYGMTPGLKIWHRPSLGIR